MVQKNRRARLKRLFLVMLVPLLLSGWWAVTREAFLPMQPVVVCKERLSEFDCRAGFRSKSELASMKNEAQLTYGVSTLLETRFQHEVQTYALPSSVAESKAAPVPEAVKILTLPPPGVRTPLVVARGWSGSCDLSAPDYSESRIWLYRCTGGQDSIGMFVLRDEKVDLKFQSLTEQTKIQWEKLERMRIARGAITLLIPLAAFALLVVLATVLARVGKFVIGGDPKRVDL